MLAEIKFMMLNRMLTLPAVGHEMRIILVDVCLVILRPRGSMVLQENHIMTARGIHCIAPILFTIGGRHFKA